MTFISHHCWSSCLFVFGSNNDDNDNNNIRDNGTLKTSSSMTSNHDPSEYTEYQPQNLNYNLYGLFYYDEKNKEFIDMFSGWDISLSADIYMLVDWLKKCVTCNEVLKPKRWPNRGKKNSFTICKIFNNAHNHLTLFNVKMLISAARYKTYIYIYLYIIYININTKLLRIHCV